MSRRFHIWTNGALVTSTFLSHLPSAAAPGPSSGPIMIISQLFQNYLNTHRRWVRGTKLPPIAASAPSSYNNPPRYFHNLRSIFHQSLNYVSGLGLRSVLNTEFYLNFPFRRVVQCAHRTPSGDPLYFFFGPPLVFRFSILPTFPYCEDRMPVCDKLSLAGPGPG